MPRPRLAAPPFDLVITIKEALTQGAQTLRHADGENSRRTARILLSYVMGVRQELLLARPEDLITASQYTEYTDSIARRALGEPLQHITGHQQFYGLDFFVTPDVLIPRPETEFVVEQVLKLARASGGGRAESELARAARKTAAPRASCDETSPTVLEIGTGSGCIAIALAAHLPSVRVIATDISRSALDVARRNADRHQVADRIEFLVGDLFSGLAPPALDQKIDFIACNPPYVPSSRPDLVQRDVRQFEPAAALYGGPDGLSFYRRLLAEAPPYLKPNGCLVCEIGYSQLEGLRAIIVDEGWELIDLIHDLQGIPRTLTLRAR